MRNVTVAGTKYLHLGFPGETFRFLCVYLTGEVHALTIPP